MNTIALPPCRHRGSSVAADRWICSCSRLVIPGRVVSASFCDQSCPYVDQPVVHPLPDVLVIEEDTCPSSPSPRMSVEAFIEAIRPGSEAFPHGWQWWQVAQTAHRLMLDQAAAVPPAIPRRFAGRGIIIAAGGPTYFPCAFVCAYVLRCLGCELPIEFWHLGPNEIPPQQAAVARMLNVFCRDAHAIHPQPRLLAGWELKTIAAIHCEFEEVLFLDADNVPAADPTYLFDDPQYREHGAIFWPDLPVDIQRTQWLTQLTWDVAGISWRDDIAFETGQFLINKRDCWHELNVAMHLNDHSDYWYRYVYGDKDTYKLAWHKLDRRYAMPAKPSAWASPAIMQHDLQGRVIFSHACQGKPQLKSGERLPALPQADLAVEAAQVLHGLLREHH